MSARADLERAEGLAARANAAIVALIANLRATLHEAELTRDLALRAAATVQSDLELRTVLLRAANAERDAARATERAAVVAWLRGYESRSALVDRDALDELAERVARGDHAGAGS